MAHQNEALFELACAAVRDRQPELVRDALEVLKHMFYRNKSAGFLEHYFRSGCHENVLQLLNSESLELRKSTLVVFGCLVSLDLDHVVNVSSQAGPRAAEGKGRLPL